MEAAIAKTRSKMTAISTLSVSMSALPIICALARMASLAMGNVVMVHTLHFDPLPCTFVLLTLPSPFVRCQMWTNATRQTFALRMQSV